MGQHFVVLSMRLGVSRGGSRPNRIICWADFGTDQPAPCRKPTHRAMLSDGVHLHSRREANVGM